MSIEKFVEEQIKKAMAEGEFDNLPGRGRPIDLEAYFRTPEDLRMGYAMLKNSNFVPEEVQLLKEVESLKEQLASCTDADERNQLTKAVREKSLIYTVLMEKHRRAK